MLTSSLSNSAILDGSDVVAAGVDRGSLTGPDRLRQVWGPQEVYLRRLRNGARVRMSRPPSVTPTACRVGALGAMGLVVSAVLAAGSAQAQSASSTLSSFRAGYGGAGLTGLQSPVSPSLISTGSQYAISDGVNQAGSVGSVFTSLPSSSQTSSSSSSGGASQSSSGVGQSAVSNARAPVATVDNSASTGQSAASDLVLNGKLNLDGGQ